MPNKVECTALDEGGQTILVMSFLVNRRDPGDKKLPRLYTNFQTVPDGEKPRLLTPEELHGVTTHEAQIINVSDLQGLFQEKCHAVQEQSGKTFDEVYHVHRDEMSNPFVCWAGLTPKLEDMMTIIKAWTILNAAGVSSNWGIDFNKAPNNPFDLARELKIKLQLVIDGVKVEA